MSTILLAAMVGHLHITVYLIPETTQRGGYDTHLKDEETKL